MTRVPLLLLLALQLHPRGATALDADEFHRLKSRLHLQSEEEALRSLRAARLEAPRPHQQKIEHVVVLFIENRAFDHFFGCMGLPGADGIPASGHLIPNNASDPSQGHVNVSCGTAPYICTTTPRFDLYSSHFAPGSEMSTYPYSAQSDDFSVANRATGVAVQMFAPEQIPVKHAVAKQFGVFNKYFTSVPSASTPNHLFAQSATSCGIRSNANYTACGSESPYFPMMTIYDNLYLHNKSFSIHCNTSQPYHCPTGLGDETIVSGIARHKDHFRSHKDFYDNAANGTLPALSWLIPPSSSTDHPCHDVSKGERLLKDIYEAIRAGPSWSKTMLLVAYDDAGAIYDHVVPPHEGVPTDGAPCGLSAHGKSKCRDFDFRRLGLRAASMLISPWVKAGSVFQEPRGKFKTSQFEHSSISATLTELFNLTGYLTQRDECFAELLSDELRTDAPMHLPAAPTHGEAAAAQHCSPQEEVCAEPEQLTPKQRRTIPTLAERIGLDLPPDLEGMDRRQAEDWLAEHWQHWL